MNEWTKLNFKLKKKTNNDDDYRHSFYSYFTSHVFIVNNNTLSKICNTISNFHFANYKICMYVRARVSFFFLTLCDNSLSFWKVSSNYSKCDNITNKENAIYEYTRIDFILLLSDEFTISKWKWQWNNATFMAISCVNY